MTFVYVYLKATEFLTHLYLQSVRNDNRRET